MHKLFGFQIIKEHEVYNIIPGIKIYTYHALIKNFTAYTAQVAEYRMQCILQEEQKLMNSYRILHLLLCSVSKSVKKIATQLFSFLIDFQFDKVDRLGNLVKMTQIKQL